MNKLFEIQDTPVKKLNVVLASKMKVGPIFTSIKHSFLLASKMSFPTLSVYKDLINAYPTWAALKSHLVGATCKLRVEDNSTAESPYALIRYVKGVSDLSNPTVRAFRSVVWDTLAHRPVSVTSWKSSDGEGLPAEPYRGADGVAAFTVEPFHDGTLIGLFWDTYSGRWRIHTRSILDAHCRYFCPRMTFADMFWATLRDFDLGTLNRSYSYSVVLQHPENRIVCSVAVPRIFWVDAAAIGADSTINWQPTVGLGPTLPHMADWSAVRMFLADLNTRFRHNYQGLVIKSAAGARWKLRTPEYNRVRGLRGNSPRRDFLWLKAWRDGTLRDYLTLFPEERRDADACVGRWKSVTQDVYRIYCDAFKARSLDRKMIPPKYRPLVYGLHSLFVETLKPAGKTLDWRVCLEHMNTKDPAQMLFVINWEFRAAARAGAAEIIPVEPSSAVGTSVDVKVDDAPDTTVSVPDSPPVVHTS